MVLQFFWLYGRYLVFLLVTSFFFLFGFRNFLTYSFGRAAFNSSFILTLCSGLVFVSVVTCEKPDQVKQACSGFEITISDTFGV